MVVILERGKKLYPSKAKDKVVKDGISADTWRIFHRNNSYIFEYLSGSHGGGTKEHTISKDDFERVRAGKMTAYDILLKYSLS